jgi:hypothetical protein
MNTFRTIDELIKCFDREKLLLRGIFSNRETPTFKYESALELVEYKEERLKYLIENGVIRDSGSFLELEDIYLRFFEEVLQINEEINVSFVQDYINNLNENIAYYLKETNDRRKYKYYRDVMRGLKQIALASVRNVVDLKRNIDNTYKNEVNYKIKLLKLKN